MSSSEFLTNMRIRNSTEIVHKNHFLEDFFEEIFWNIFGLIINTHDWLAIQLILLTLAAVHLPDPIPAGS
ncbi:unnamed protein product, partial [Heterotrigona itama]